MASISLSATQQGSARVPSVLDTIEAAERGLPNETETLTLVRLSRDHKDSTLYVDLALARARAMAERSGANATLWVDELWKLYAQRSPALGLWAFLGEGPVVGDVGVVGHMVATIQVWDYEYVAWVNQVELDERVSQAVWDRALRALDGWVAEANAGLKPEQRVRRFMMTTAHPKVFERKAGFRSVRTMMERALVQRG